MPPHNSTRNYPVIVVGMEHCGYLYEKEEMFQIISTW